MTVYLRSLFLRRPASAVDDAVLVELELLKAQVEVAVKRIDEQIQAARRQGESYDAWLEVRHELRPSVRREVSG